MFHEKHYGETTCRASSRFCFTVMILVKRLLCGTIGAKMEHPLDQLIARVLPEGSLFAVGGRVRDEFRAQFEGHEYEPKDLDYVVVGVPLAELEARLATIGRVDVVGALFAVVKFSSPAGSADVALPRRERSTGAGHRDFAIETGPDVPLDEDLGRRDFRMNAIARRISDGAIIDPHGGLSDIFARRIDILGPHTFEEDPLRMLRAAQFAARFGFALSSVAREAMRVAAPLVAHVSAERISDELVKLLGAAPKPSIGIEILRETGVLAHVWPELLEGLGIDQNAWHAYDVYRHTLATLDATPPGDPVLRLAALLHDVGKPRTKDGPHFYRHEHVGADLTTDMMERLRFSHETVRTVSHLVRAHMYSADPEMQPKTLRRFVRRVGEEHLDRLFALRRADIAGSGLPKRSDENERFVAAVARIVAERPPLRVSDLAIGGTDVISLMIERGLVPPGFRGDRRVGAILSALLDLVVDDPERNQRSALLAAAQAILAEIPA